MLDKGLDKDILCGRNVELKRQLVIGAAEKRGYSLVFRQKCLAMAGPQIVAMYLSFKKRGLIA